MPYNLSHYSAPETYKIIWNVRKGTFMSIIHRYNTMELSIDDKKCVFKKLSFVQFYTEKFLSIQKRKKKFKMGKLNEIASGEHVSTYFWPLLSKIWKLIFLTFFEIFWKIWRNDMNFYLYDIKWRIWVKSLGNSPSYAIGSPR